MTISVNCPVCSQVLVAPDELIGKLAACPGCGSQFPITGGSTGSPPLPPSSVGAAHATRRQESSAMPSASAPPPPPGSPANTATMSAAATTAPPSTVQRAPVEAYAPPTTPQPKPAAPQPSPPREAPTQHRQAPPPSVPAPRPKQPATSSPTAKAATPRAAKSARFIAAEATDTAVQLGQDGQLPSLVLEEGKAKDSSDDEEKKSSPFLMVGVLCVSLGMSVAMLVLNPEVRRSERQDKPAARQAIEDYYIWQPGQIRTEQYQQWLREALRAHNRRDYATEREMYQRVFQRLRTENNNQVKGLTGRVRGEHPSDQKLEGLLSTLLRRD